MSLSELRSSAQARKGQAGAIDTSRVSQTGAIEAPFGQRILIVEDELIVALDLSDIVEAFGCIPVIVTRVAPAIVLVEEEDFDVAILDINIHGEAVYPVADELTRQNIPYIFATGFSIRNVADGYRQFPILAKPYSPRHVVAALYGIWRASDA